MVYSNVFPSLSTDTKSSSGSINDVEVVTSQNVSFIVVVQRCDQKDKLEFFLDGSYLVEGLPLLS